MLQRPKLNPIVLTALLSPNFECIQRLRQQEQNHSEAKEKHKEFESHATNKV
jgi:hypothetical protein